MALSDGDARKLSTEQMVEIAQRTRARMIDAADDLNAITAELRRRLKARKEEPDK